MARKKSNSRNAARALESLVSPILEVNYEDPLFTVAAHPSKPILLSGLVTGHIYCNTYDAEKLEESQSTKREELELLEKEAFKQGKISQVNKSVSQTKKKWWSVINDIKDVNEQNHVVTNWKTKRHKGSCRHAIFDPLESSLGENIYTVGTDHIIKKAATETGKVVGKVSIVDHFTGKDSVTKLCHSTTHPFLLSGTEDGHVLVFDSKNLGSDKLKFKVEKAHDDAINYILPMYDVSAYHYLTLGSTTLSHIDIRKGIINQSDDQEDELLSMCYANDTEKNDMVLVSHGEGIITIWKNSKNRFQDQLTRIKVNKSASIDAIVPTMNNEDDEMSSSVWCGDSEGLLHRVNYKQGKVVETRVHSSLVGKVADEVGILDIDYDYRLISAGMDSLKIWSNQAVEPTEDSDSGWDDTDDENGGDNDGPDDDSDDDSDSSDGFSATDDSGSDIEDASDDIDGASDVSIEDIEGRAHDGGEDIPDEDDEEDEEEEEEKEEQEEEAKDKSIQFLQTRRRNFAEIIKSSQPKKKTIDFNKLSKPEEPEETPNKKQKIKKKQMTTKQLSSLQKHEHGIRRFDGL